MGIASAIAEKIRGYNCERLVKYTAQEVSFTGISGEVTGYKINIGTFSNSVKVTNTVTEVMKALDNNQYLLCLQAHDFSASPELRDKCLQVRVMCTLGLTNFQALAALQEQGQPLSPEIKEWIKNMNALVFECMRSFLPSSKMLLRESSPYRVYMRKGVKREGKSSQKKPSPKARGPPQVASERPTISKIMKYQGIDEDDLANAIRILKES